ncbi:hypothetical protein BsWGS_07466 [Bradybaena similaris]
MTGHSWDPRWCYGDHRKAITVWFLAWEWRLEHWWSNPCAKKVVSPSTKLTALCPHFSIQTVTSPVRCVPDSESQFQTDIWMWNAHSYGTDPLQNVILVTARMKDIRSFASSPASYIFMLQVSLMSCVHLHVGRLIPFLPGTMPSITVLFNL